MKLELLVSTMNQKNTTIAKKMNISTDAIIVNQSDFFNYTEEKNGKNIVRMYTFNERGVGKSRNNALMRSDADICVLADDDMVYTEDYKIKILEEFKENPKADVIIFSVNIIDKNGERTRKLKSKRVRFLNSFKYGAVRVAFKREKILKHNIHFSLLFGGGAKYGSGEDTVFITDCLKKGLKVYTSSKKIADVYNYQSSWFTGYNNKYFFDKGYLYGSIAPKLSFMLALQFLVRKYPIYKNQVKFQDAYKNIMRGIKKFKK
jgi:glycosyltransferase involved in cell wall biosynthesis